MVNHGDPSSGKTRSIPSFLDRGPKMALGRQLSLGIASVEENCLAQVTVGVAHPKTDQHGVQVNSQPLDPTRANCGGPPQFQSAVKGPSEAFVEID